MADVLVDPTNDNYALIAGELGVAVCLGPPLADPLAPTVRELAQFTTIIGYTTAR